MRYAIHFTPTAGDPLSHIAASWLGRDVYSGLPIDPPPGIRLCPQVLSFHTAVPRRYGFHAQLKAPFKLRSGLSEENLLRELMCFASTVSPFELPELTLSKIGHSYGLTLNQPNERLHLLAGSIVEHFDRFTEPMSFDESQSRLTDHLSANQLTKLSRWGDPYVMEEFKFSMALTGEIYGANDAIFDGALRSLFEPLLQKPVPFANLALFIEDEPGAPFRVHSLHPLGRIKEHCVKARRAKKTLAPARA